MLEKILNLNSLMLLSFIVVNIILSICYSRKIKTLRDFSIGTKNLPTGSIIASIVAFYVSSSMFQINVEQAYNGLYNAIPLIIGVICSFFISIYIIAPRAKEFLNNNSIAEAMGDLYGTHVRIIVSVSGILFSIIIVAIQFNISSTLLSYIFGFEHLHAAIASALTIVIYSVLNGIRTITFSNIIQFFTLVSLVPALIVVLLQSVNLDSFLFKFQENLLLCKIHIFDFNNLWNLLSLLTFFAIPSYIYPAGFQKILIAKNIMQLRKAYIISLIILIVIMLLMLLIGFLLFCINPNIQSNIFLHLIDSYSSNLKGVLVISIVAMSTSSADYHINSSTMLFINDIYKLSNFKIKNELLLVRTTASVIGITCFALSLLIENNLNLLLVATTFYSSVMLVPLVMTTLGLRSSFKAIITGMILGLLTSIIWKLIFAENILSNLIPGIVANLIGLVSYHYFFESKLKWQGIKDRIPLIALRQDRKEKYEKFILSIKNFNIFKFCANNLPKEDAIYTYFGFFGFISICSSLYTLPYVIQLENYIICNIIYYSVAAIATLFFTYPIYSSTVKNTKLIAIFWNISTLYVLVFSSFLLLIISAFHKLQLIIFFMNMTVICMLFRWQIALLIIFFGILFTIQFYKFYTGVTILPNTTQSLRFRRIYLLFLFNIIVIIFFRPKQNSYKLANTLNANLEKKVEERTEELKKALIFKNDIINNVNHEIRNPMHGIIAISNMINDKWDDLSNTIKRKAISQIRNAAQRLNDFAENMLDLSQFSSDEHYLNINEDVSLNILIKDIVSECKYMYVGDKNLYFILEIEECKVACDEIKITQVIQNLINNAITYTPEGSISIKLEPIKDYKVQFSIKDQGIGIPEEELMHIFKPFARSSRTKNIKGRGIGLALSEKIILEHNGDITASNNPEGGAIFQFTLPIHYSKSN